MADRKKLSIFRKALGKVGKRVMWYLSKKINRLFLHAAWKSAILTFANLTGDDPSEATRIWYELGKAAGDSLMYTWLDKAKMLYSRKLEDMKVVIESAWHAFLGNSPDKIKYYEAGDGHEVPRIVWQFSKCWICSEIEKDEDLKHLDFTSSTEFGYGSCASGIFETALQMVQDYVGNLYNVIVRETKCFMRGDDYQEFTAYFYPKEETDEDI